jgi:hypothetical protein
MPRRFVDRVISLVHPVHRYRCPSFICNWEGNLPHNATVPDQWDGIATHANSRASASSLLPGGTSCVTHIDKKTM